MQNNQKTLLIVVNHSEFFLSHRLPIAKRALRERFNVHIATSKSPALPHLKQQGFPVHTIRLQPGGINPVADFLLLISLIRLYRRLRPDLVHHITVKPVLYGSLAARICRIHGVVNALTGLGHLFVSRSSVIAILRKIIITVMRVGLRHPNSALILQNPDDCDEMIHHGVIAPEKVKLIKGSGVDPEEFEYSEESNGDITITLASRMIREKGIYEFTGAARIVKTTHPEYRFLLVGKPDDNNPTAISREQLEKWNREGAVQWIDYKDNVGEIFAKSHIVCLPTYYGEGIPKVLIEAASCGRPIITTDMPGCREIAVHGENGLLVPPNDVAALADAIEKMAMDKDMRVRMGRAGREKVLQEYTLSMVLDQTFAVYNALGFSPGCHED